MLPGLVVFGLGLSMTVSPLTAAILAAVDPAQSGIGSAINNAISRIAGLIAIAFTAVIIGGAMDFDGISAGRRSSSPRCWSIAGLVSWAGIRNDAVRLRARLAEGGGGMSRPGDTAARIRRR